MIDWYDRPELYDIVYGADSAREAALLVTLAKRHGRAPERILEPACGSGRLLHALAAPGRRLVGFDRNEACVRHARARLCEAGANGKVFVADLVDFDAGERFDLAFCLLSTFKYLPRERDARAHLRRVAAALRPGGIYVVGLHLTDAENSGASRERWTGRSRALSVSVELECAAPDLRRRRERVRCRLTRREGRSVEHIENRWSWRTYTPEQIHRLVAAVATLELVASTDFDGRARTLEDDRLDKLLVLRRTQAGN